VPGGPTLIEWFGRVPHFHDAELLEINLASQGKSTLRIHAFRMTDEVDERGYYVLDKHVVVTITLEGVTHVSLNDFNLVGIIGDLEVIAVPGGVQLAWDGSYGVQGTLCAQQMRIDLQPGKPE
jgi:hypothetical protein